MYPVELTIPMTKDLTDFGFKSLKSSEEVIDLINNHKGTVLLVVNSVCGCAAANARPGAKIAIQNEKRPDVCATVFAGVDREAVETARDLLLPYPPSSPAIALFKNGRVVHMLERHHIEGRSAQMIAANLMEAFNAHC